jgi:hypothetical protein
MVLLIKSTNSAACIGRDGMIVELLEPDNRPVSSGSALRGTEIVGPSAQIPSRDE